MKNLIYVIIIAILIGTVPMIPYERELKHGVTVIENKTLLSWVWEHYQYTQKQNEEVREQAPVAQ